MDDLNKYIKINNNIIIKPDEFFLKKPKLRENSAQLTDVKKTKFGFKLNETVIDVEQDGYSICYGNDVLYTYGIEPCCGIVLCDENTRILFHVDGMVTPNDILDVTNKINLSQNTEVIVIPGASCGIPGSFDYKKLEENYTKKGYKVREQRIPATFGFITLESDKVTIGTGISRDLDVVLSIPKRKAQNKEYTSYSLDELIALKQELLQKFENNSSKKR